MGRSSRNRHQRDIIQTTEQVQTSQRYYTNRRSRYRHQKDIIQTYGAGTDIRKILYKHRRSRYRHQRDIIKTAEQVQTSDRYYTHRRSRYRHQKDIIQADGAGTDIRKILYQQTEQVQTSERYYTNRRSRYRYHRDIIQTEEQVQIHNSTLVILYIIVFNCGFFLI